MSSIVATATAVPGIAVPQTDVVRLARLQAESTAPQLLDKIALFENTGIENRHFVEPLHAYFELQGWSDRMSRFERSGLDLLEATTTKLLEEASSTTGRTWTPDDIDGVVFVTTTGITTPSLDALLADRLGFPAHCQRVPVWGLGCAGGVAGLRLAQQLTTADPGTNWVVLALEACSLSFRPDGDSLRSMVANALFADGCAGAIVTSEATGVPGLRLGPGASHRWPDSRDVMGWDVRDDGLDVVFSPTIPDLLAADLGSVVSSFLVERGRSREAFASGSVQPVFHPGGAKILRAYESALGLRPDALAPSREILRRYGNMSSPTVLFVLDHVLRQAPREDTRPMLAVAVGPGFSAELLWMERET